MHDIDKKPATISEVLDELSLAAGSGEISVDEILNRFQSQGLAFLLLILTIPCCISFIYGIKQILSIPILLICAQITVGRKSVWLPYSIRQKSISSRSVLKSVRQARKILRPLDSIGKERFSIILRLPALSMIGACLIVLAIEILLPFPGTNTIPGIAIVISSFGMLRGDGALTLAGVLIGIVWTAFLALLLYSMGAAFTS